MGKKNPEWQSALALLNEVEKDENFNQSAELLNQKSVCQHRLADYENSLASCVKFITNFPDSKLLLSALFLKAENLFLLKKIDEALVSYDAFLEGGRSIQIS